MGKSIAQDKKEQVKNEILRMLSVDGRRSMADMATKLGIPKATFYHIYVDLVNEYGLRFVPEINLEEVWRYEFIRLSKKGDKREIVERQIDKSGKLGFSEYTLFIKFTKKQPSDKELASVFSEGYFTQFIAKLDGDYDLFVYGVTRSYREASATISSMLEKLNYDMEIVMDRVFTEFGFFPLRRELVEEFQILDTYKELLLALTNDGKAEFQEIAKLNKKTPEHFMYAYQLLRRSGILREVTYYETMPKNTVNAMIMLHITNPHAFKTSRNALYKDVISYNGAHSEYVHICDSSSPYGMLLTCSFPSSDALGKFVDRIKKGVSGISIKTYLLTGVIYGNLGTRNYDARYSMQYKALERQKLVRSFDPGTAEHY